MANRRIRERDGGGVGEGGTSVAVDSKLLKLAAPRRSPTAWRASWNTMAAARGPPACDVPVVKVGNSQILPPSGNAINL